MRGSDPIVARNITKILFTLLFLKVSTILKQLICLRIERRQMIDLMRTSESQIQAHSIYIR
ncbi:hypothetical protein DFS13_107223 [Burkholderia sp. 28_3]|nr:hypothetical protein A8E76_35900 [Burkholderia cenocepacia]PZX01516.1 hypothetical protein DFS13_107223 [Burkholderia sp. 28_3]